MKSIKKFNIENNYVTSCICYASDGVLRKDCSILFRVENFSEIDRYYNILKILYDIKYINYIFTPNVYDVSNDIIGRIKHDNIGTIYNEENDFFFVKTTVNVFKKIISDTIRTVINHPIVFYKYPQEVRMINDEIISVINDENSVNNKDDKKSEINTDNIITKDNDIETEETKPNKEKNNKIINEPIDDDDEIIVDDSESENEVKKHKDSDVEISNDSDNDESYKQTVSKSRKSKVSNCAFDLDEDDVPEILITRVEKEKKKDKRLERKKK